MQKRNTKKIISIITLIALLVSLAFSGFDAMGNVEAAGKIRISSKKITLTAPNSKQLFIKQGSKKIKKGVKWSTKNKKVATVTKKGKVTAKGVGMTVITAKYKRKLYKCKITVKAPKYTISDTDITLNIGDTKQINLVKGTNIVKSNIKWSSDNSSIVKVSKSGLVTAVSSGETVVTATSFGKKYNCKVKVREIVSDNIVVLDNNYVKISTKQFKYLENGDVEMKFLIENKSSLNLSMKVYDLGINGITFHNGYSMYTKVSSKKKATGTFTIDREALEYYDINYIRELRFLFWGYDDAKSFKEFESDIVSIKTNLYNSTTNKVYKGKKIYNKNGIIVDYLKFEDGKYLFAITNTMDCYINYDLKGLTINDYTSSEMDYDTYDECIFDGEQSIISIKPSSDFLNDNGIKQIDKIEFYLEYRLKDNYLDKNTTDIICTYVK